MIGLALSAVLRSLDGWVIVDTPKLTLVGDTLVPAIAGWRREHAQRTAPDWVCHVPTPSDSPKLLRRALTTYEQAGVKHMWLFDPVARQLEVYGGDGRWAFLRTVSSTETTTVLEPFSGLTLELAGLWGA